MSKNKLNQVIAVEKGIKSKVVSALTELYHTAQIPVLFVGFRKHYEKKDEAGEDLPPENLRVSQTVDNILKQVENSLSELMTVTARKDYTNCVAKADVKIGETVLIAQTPVSYLLFLEKQFTDFRTFVSKLPILDEAESWVYDAESQLYKTDPVKTHRTKKIQKGNTLYEATKEHPAQTQLITEDVLEGYWNIIKMSGAWPKAKKIALIDKVDKLLNAIKEAREEANSQEEIPVPNDIAKVFDYLLVQ